MSEMRRQDGIETGARLAALYRAAAEDAPPAALDDAIRAAARRAVSSKPQLAGSPFSRSWHLPLSIAAVVLLSVSLVMVIREEAPEIAAPPRAEVPLTEAVRKPAADESAGKIPKTTLVPDAPRSNLSLKPPHQRAAKPAREGEAPASAPKPLAAPAAGAAAEAKAQLKPEAASADSAVRELSRARASPALAPGPAPQMAGTIQSFVNLPPEKWLEQIEELRKQSRLEEARTSLTEFKKRYPEYPLPASLKDGIKP